MQAALRDELAQPREPRGQRIEHLTERFGLDRQVGDTGPFTRDTQEFNVHRGLGAEGKPLAMIASPSDATDLTDESPRIV
jgi:hypothetical protein